MPLLAAALVAASASPVAAQAGDCTHVFTPEQSTAIFTQLQGLPTQDGCRMAGLRTDRSTLHLRFMTPGDEAAFTATPWQCGGSGRRAGALSLHDFESFERVCPAMASAFEALFATPADGQVTELASPHPVTSRRAGRWAWALALAGLLLACPGLLRRERRPPTLRLAALTTFAVAVAARLGTNAQLVNWYAVVPPTGGGGSAAPRFGPAFAQLATALERVGVSTDLELMGLLACLGALQAPMLVLIARELRFDPRAALGAGLCWAVAPLAVRISHSPSAHTLSSTLVLLSLLLWLRGLRSRSVLVGLSAVALLPLIGMSRPDAWTQAALVPLLGLAPLAGASTSTRAGRLPGRLLRAGLFSLAWLAAGAFTYVVVVAHARHPFPPTASRLEALGSIAPELVEFAFDGPPWVGAATLGLALVGLLALARRSRLSAVLLVAAFFACFGLVGRSLQPDGLVGARYFLLPLALLSLASGAGFGVLANLAGGQLGRRFRTSGARRGWTVASAAALVGVLALEAGPALAYRYAFQDEYDFVTEHLVGLPAGCTVYQLPVRQERFERDLDCCLDLPRSPIHRRFAELRFAYLPEERPAAALRALEPTECSVLYLGAACQLDRTDTTVGRNPLAVRDYPPACEAQRNAGPYEELAATSVSSNSTQGFFSAPVRIELLRLAPR